MALNASMDVASKVCGSLHMWLEDAEMAAQTAFESERGSVGKVCNARGVGSPAGDKEGVAVAGARGKVRRAGHLQLHTDGRGAKNGQGRTLNMVNRGTGCTQAQPEPWGASDCFFRDVVATAVICCQSRHLP